jgi:hypothetical protein
MAHLLSYTSGVVGHGLSNDLDTAIDQAIDRCTEMGMGANILNRSTSVVLAVITPTSEGFKAKKME